MGKIFSNPKMLILATIALVALLVCFLGGAVGAGLGLGFLGGPIPLIQLPAEYIGVHIGSYKIMNTYVMFWLAGIILLILAWRSTYRMREVPGRMQGLFELVYEFFIKLAEAGAGGKRGRIFLPVVTAIFFIVLFSNWLGTLPGVGTIGRIETVEEVLEHKVAKELESKYQKDDNQAGEKKGAQKYPHADHLINELHHGGFAHFIKHNNEEFNFALAHTLHYHRDDKFVVFTGASGIGTIKLGRGENKKVRLHQIIEIPENEKKIVNKLNSSDGERIFHQIKDGMVLSTVDEPDLGEDRRAGLLVPYFRGASTDLNTTLAIALVAMISVQFWGIKALGFRSYAGKFFINPIKASPVDTFVGLLEFIGEFIKIISFTFRLFGNMFAGEILLIAMGFLLPLVGIIPFLGLELFVGVIQAIIFSVLTLIFGSLAIMSHGHDDHDQTEEAHH